MSVMMLLRMFAFFVLVDLSCANKSSDVVNELDCSVRDLKNLRPVNDGPYNLLVVKYLLLLQL